MTFNEKLIYLDTRLRELRKEVEDDLKKYSILEHTDEKMLLNNPEYCAQWVKWGVKTSSDWFMREIYK